MKWMDVKGGNDRKLNEMKYGLNLQLYRIKEFRDLTEKEKE